MELYGTLWTLVWEKKYKDGLRLVIECMRAGVMTFCDQAKLGKIVRYVRCDNNVLIFLGIIKRNFFKKRGLNTPINIRSRVPVAQ